MAVGSKVGEAYVELQARMAKFESQLRSAEVMTGKSVNKMQAKFKALAPTFRKVGIGMAVAGGAITAALGLTIKSSMSFNKEMANIATLIPGATERVLELKGAIRSMAVDVGKSTGDLAQGGYQVISAFGDTADTVAILEIAAKAATAGVASTTSAINLLSAVTKGYGDTSKAAVQKASDLAFMTVKLGQTDFPQLEASIGRVIPLTAEMGVSQEELFAVMATGTGVTGKAAEVATQFRGAMQSLMAPTADMIELLEEKGYASGKAMLADLGLAGSLELIKKKADETNTPLQKYISSIEGQTIALALTGTQADTYKEKLEAMMDVTNQTDIAFKEQTEGINKAGFAFEQAKIRIGILGQEIGDRLLPMITPLIEKITAIVKKMSDWAKEHPGLSSGIVKVAAVLGPLLIGLGGVLVILPKLIALVPILKIGMIKLGGALHFMLGPIGLIIIGIGAAVAAFIYFYKTNEKFAAFINKMGEAIKKFVKAGWDRLVWFIKNWGQVWEAATQIVKETLLFMGKAIWKVLTNKEAFITFIKLWGTLYASVGRIITDTMVFVGKVIARASSIIWAPIWESLKWLKDQIIYYFSLGIEKARNAIYAGINFITNKFVAFVNFITQGVINPIIGGFEAFANAIIGSIAKVIATVAKMLDKIPKIFLPKVVEDFIESAKNVEEAWEVELGRIPAIAEDALTIKIPESTLKEPKKFADRMSDAWKTIKAQYVAIPGDLAIYLDQLGEEWNTITAVAGEFGEAIDFTDYTAKVSALITKLKELGVDVTALEEAAKGADAKLEKLAKTLERIRDIVIGTGKKLTKSFDDFKDVAISATASVMDALIMFLKKIDGVTEAIEKIPPALTKIKDVEALGDINEALLILTYLLKPLPKAIEKARLNLEKIKDVKVLGDINEALLRLAYLLKPLPKAIEKIPRALEKIKDVEALGDINEALLRLAYLLKPLPRAIEKIPRALEQIKDVKAIGDINEALLRLAYLLKPLPLAVEKTRLNLEKIKDVEAIGDINDAFLIMAYLLKPLPEAIKKIPLAIEKARDVIVPAGVDIEEVIKGIGYAASDAADKIKSGIGVATNIMNFFTGVINGTKEGFEALEGAFMSLIAKIPLIGGFINAFYELGKAIGLVTVLTEEAAVALMNAFGIIPDTVVDLYESIQVLESAFEDVGLALADSIGDAERAIKSLMQTQEDLDLSTREKLIRELDNYYDYRVLKEMDLTELLALSAETREKLEKGTLEEIAESAEEAAEREKDAKVGTLKAIEDAYAKESALIDKKIALLEIEIKLLMAAALVEQGKLKEAEKLRKEAMNDLKNLLYTEEELLEMERKRQKEREGFWDEHINTTKEATKVTKEYGKEGEIAAEKVQERLGGVIGALIEVERETDTARIGMEHWREEGLKGTDQLVLGFKEVEEATRDLRIDIGKIPKLIDFDIIGNLHMPTIKAPGDIFFDIWGRYRPPNIPSAQIGVPYIPRTKPYVVHKKEAILNPRQAEEWRQGRGVGVGGGGEPKVVERRTVEQNITIQSLFPPDDPVLWDRIWREGLRAAAERESGRRVG